MTNPFLEKEEKPDVEKSSVTLPGIVDRIIPSPDPQEPEKAQIAVEGADHLYREIRVENRLVDHKGNEVALKEGADVEVTIEADLEATENKVSNRKSGKQ